MNLTYAEIKLPEGVNLPQRYRSYVIKVDGNVVGNLEWSYFPKNSGGSRWKARYQEPLVGGDPVGPARSVDGRDFKKVLAALRDSIEDTVRLWGYNKDRLLAYRRDRAELEAKGFKPEVIAEMLWERDSIGDAQT